MRPPRARRLLPVILRPFPSIPSSRALHALLAGALACASGCAYRLEGRVVDGFGGASVVREGDDEARKSGIPGVTIELVRDAETMKRAVAARATSDSSGRFELEIDGFGAGWMQEEWLLRARRNGFETVEQQVDLPGDPKGRVMVLGMARGKSRPFREPESSRRILDEVREYDRGVGSLGP